MGSIWLFKPGNQQGKVCLMFEHIDTRISILIHIALLVNFLRNIEGCSVNRLRKPFSVQQDHFISNCPHLVYGTSVPLLWAAPLVTCPPQRLHHLNNQYTVLKSTSRQKHPCLFLTLLLTVHCHLLFLHLHVILCDFSFLCLKDEYILITDQINTCYAFLPQP